VAQLWNSPDAYPGESGAYLCATVQDIPHFSRKNLCELNKLDGFGLWTENPRVGGSIPPLATIKSIFQIKKLHRALGIFV
jgi:hypothetical protein